MGADRLELRVALGGSGLDDEALADCAVALGDELAEVDVDEVSMVSGGEAPPGAKGVEAMALGALVVRLARSREVLGRLVGAVRDWVSRNDAASVRLEIDGDLLEITGGVSTAERNHRRQRPALPAAPRAFRLPSACRAELERAAQYCGGRWFVADRRCSATTRSPLAAGGGEAPAPRVVALGALSPRSSPGTVFEWGRRIDSPTSSMRCRLASTRVGHRVGHGALRKT